MLQILFQGMGLTGAAFSVTPCKVQAATLFAKGMAAWSPIEASLHVES